MCVCASRTHRVRRQKPDSSVSGIAGTPALHVFVPVTIATLCVFPRAVARAVAALDVFPRAVPRAVVVLGLFPRAVCFIRGGICYIPVDMKQTALGKTSSAATALRTALRKTSGAATALATALGKSPSAAMISVAALVAFMGCTCAWPPAGTCGAKATRFLCCVRRSPPRVMFLQRAISRAYVVLGIFCKAGLFY